MPTSEIYYRNPATIHQEQDPSLQYSVHHPTGSTKYSNLQFSTEGHRVQQEHYFHDSREAYQNSREFREKMHQESGKVSHRNPPNFESSEFSGPETSYRSADSSRPLYTPPARHGNLSIKVVLNSKC